MAVILGIDIGTSSLKAMLLDTEKGVLTTKAKGYGVDIPLPGYAEQDPQVWWEALLKVLGLLKEYCPAAYECISAIGFSGQMHGLVLTDPSGTPVRPAIIWLDQRAKKQLSEIENTLSEHEMGEILRNRVSSGFAFPSVLWVREMEPEIFSKAVCLLCPKDYIRLKMTGRVGTDVVDASGTGIFSTARRIWAWDVIDRFRLPRELFPEVAESGEIAGYITRECAEETGLKEGVPVIYGTGDQPAQSIGNGVIKEGRLISNIGTGGQISAFMSRPVYDRKLRTNTFCHAIPGAYTVFGAMLCSGMSMSWAKNSLFHLEDYDLINQEAGAVPAGSEGLIYLPYLSGERTPHMNPNAKGMFFGMTLAHGRGHFLRAVMEGVTYGLKDCLGILNESGVNAPMVIASGGGTASDLWLQIQADILQKQVCVCRVEEQACLGCCILAAAGTGALPSLEEGIRRFVTMDDRLFEPMEGRRGVYEEGYGKFCELYHRTKSLM